MDRPPDLDLQHLKALSICHYVLGGLVALISSLFLIHVSMGIMMITSPSTMSGSGPPPPPFMGWMFLMIGSGAVLAGWTFAAFIITAGRFLARRKHHLFCLIMAGVSCAWAPLGTVLGVFTIIVLLRPSVKELFQADDIRTVRAVSEFEEPRTQ
jgi:hypothetical protein